MRYQQSIITIRSQKKKTERCKNIPWNFVDWNHFSRIHLLRIFSTFSVHHKFKAPNRPRIHFLFLLFFAFDKIMERAPIVPVDFFIFDACSLFSSVSISHFWMMRSVIGSCVAKKICTIYSWNQKLVRFSVFCSISI